MAPFINIHSHKRNSEHLIILNVSENIDWHEGKFFSFGIHPWDIDKIELETDIKILDELCKSKKIIAVGEIGIDRAIQIPVETQTEVFIKQLIIANQYNMPVIIHCVKAWSDLLSLKKSIKVNTPWIFHGFTGNLQTAHQLIQNGMYLSFGLKLIQSQKLQETFKQLPIHSIFLETDDSDAIIEDIYQKAAELYDICIEELKTKMYQNFIKVFGEQWQMIG
jgi:TatD DNase family protein